MEDSEVATSTPSKAMAVHASSQSASSAYRLLSPSFYTSFLPSLWGESRGPEVEIAVIDGKSNNQRQLESEGPCLIFHVHGGGFISQSSKSHISYLKQWAATTGIPILSIDYSLAPEYPYPTAHHQCYAAYKWVLSNYSELGFSPNGSDAPLRILVVGDSAGGNLVAGITLRAIAEGLPLPVGVVLVYPALFLSLAGSVSRTIFNHDPVLNFPSTRLCVDSYVPEHLRSAALTDPYLSPSMAPPELLAKFPPTHITSGGLDPLLDDGVHFAYRLQKESRPVELRIYDNLPHGFMNVSESIPSAKFAIVDIAATIAQFIFANQH